MIIQTLLTLKLLNWKAQPFICTPECWPRFYMLCSRLTNTQIVQLPDPNRPYLLFTDASKFCYSGVLTNASTAYSNEVLLKILTKEAIIIHVDSQTQDLWLESNVIHLVAYIPGSFGHSQWRWPAIIKECFSVFISIKKCSFTYKTLTY